MINYLNYQIQKEFEAERLYLVLSIAAQIKQFPGIAKYFRKKSQEEKDHAFMIIDTLISLNKPVYLKDIPHLNEKYQPMNLANRKIHELFLLALSQEVNNTNTILALDSKMVSSEDVIFKPLIDKLIDEQVEEIKEIKEYATKAALAQKDTSALFLLDKELSELN